MTIDERLDRLTERHEALTQSMELHQMQWEERFRKVLAMIEQNQQAIARTQQQIERTQLHLDATQRQLDQTDRQMRKTDKRIEILARIAQMHEDRLDNLEGAAG